MKKLLLGSVATGALIAAGSANAADLAVKAPRVAPVAPPVPVFSWTGCFVGAHVGWGWGRHDVTESFTCVSEHTHTTSAAGATNLDSSGAIFGGQVGCDYQFGGFGKGVGGYGGPGSWVIGVQFAGSAADINGKSPDPFDPSDQSDTLAVKTDWLGSVTGRLGFTAFSPTMLWYVRGGWAFAHERWDIQHTDLFFGAPSERQINRNGWTVGVGWEWAFTPNWTAFVEWDHYQFNTKNIASVSFSSGASSVVTNRLDAKERIETVKIGVNYRFNFLFGKGKAPVVAKY